MKQLTQAEFDALPNDRPLRLDVDGVPPSSAANVLNWAFDEHRWYMVNVSTLDVDYPIYHKMPANISEG